MSDQRVFHGARATFIVNGKKVGIATNVSYSVEYDTVPSYILGRVSAAEITYTGQSPVSVSASGLRVINNGAYVATSLPKLQDILEHNEITISIYDRVEKKEILTVVGCRPTGYSTGVASRSISDLTVNFMGRIASDESGTQGEPDGSTDVLSGQN